jgi:hypothetical protein
LGVILLVLAAGVFFLLRSKPAWIVEDVYSKPWEEILADLPPPQFKKTVILGPDGVVPRGHFGFIITRRGPEPVEKSGEPAGPVILYPGLANTAEYKGAMVLALDPWMVFRDFKDPVVSRSRVDSPMGGEGVLIVPGRDRNVVWAWTAQLLQRQPGIFPLEEALWAETAETLFRDRRFQPGALTYGWMDAMLLLYRSSPAWIYAPLSRIRQESPQATSNLEANRFPEREDWHEFGLQADILWAVPFGTERELRKLEETRAWLGDPGIQTTIANKLGWIPAHRDGTPYNAIALEARRAWLSSSFIWQPGH